MDFLWSRNANNKPAPQTLVDMDAFYGLPSSQQPAEVAKSRPLWQEIATYKACPWQTWLRTVHAQDLSRGNNFRMPPGADDFFVGPFLYQLIIHHINDVPNAVTHPELYIEFIECFVADFLVLRHNGAGRAEFLKQARSLYQGQDPMALIRSLGHAWDPTTNPNFPELLAFNACRCLLDEGIPMVMQADRPRDTAINDMYLVFDVAGKSFRLTDKGGAKDPMHLLHSFKNRVKHLHTASVRRTGKRWVQ